MIAIELRSAQFRQDGLNGFGELFVNGRIHGTMLVGCACGKRAEIVAAFPVALRSDRSRAKTSAAIRADIVQDIFDAGTAEGAFKCAYHRVRGIGRERRVAVLASGSQFKHGSILLCEGQAH